MARKSKQSSPAPAPTPPAVQPVEKSRSDRIIISGKGTVPVVADGALVRLPRGVAVKVTSAQLAALERGGVEFK